jgi:hypothetical protein
MNHLSGQFPPFWTQSLARAAPGGIEIDDPQFILRLAHQLDERVVVQRDDYTPNEEKKTSVKCESYQLD